MGAGEAARAALDQAQHDVANLRREMEVLRREHELAMVGAQSKEKSALRRCAMTEEALKRAQIQATEGQQRALDLEPRNRRCVAALARLEDASGNKARAARYFNVARDLLKEQRRREAEEKKSGRAKLTGGSRGVWAPSEAASAGYAQPSACA